MIPRRLEVAVPMVVSRSPELHTDGTIETLHPLLDIALEVVVNILSLLFMDTASNLQ